jgi:hypothetical protein
MYFLPNVRKGTIQRHAYCLSSCRFNIGSEILACELWPLLVLTTAKSEGREKKPGVPGREGRPTLVDQQCGPLALKAMCQGAAAAGGVGAAIGQALVHLPDDNQCEVQVLGLVGGLVQRPSYKHCSATSGNSQLFRTS